MSCTAPIRAYRQGPEGVLSFYQPDESYVGMRLPCGRCLGCRTRVARDWAIRCGLELSHADGNACFLTLTYDDVHCPPTLVKPHLSSWLKRVRSRGLTVRFFASGEYGERTSRPHYHVLLYGTRGDAALQDCWPHGYLRTDSITPGSINYVAGYAQKKLYAYGGDRHERVDPDTGELYTWEPPFLHMSRRPGIGGLAREHWQSWRSSAIYNGTEVPVPRFLHNAWLSNASDTEQQRLKQEKYEYNLEHYNSLRTLANQSLINNSRRAIAESRRTKL